MSNDADLRDDLDFAIEAIEKTREEMPDNQEVAEKMAVTVLSKKLLITRAKAEELIRHAVNYLDG